MIYELQQWLGFGLLIVLTSALLVGWIADAAADQFVYESRVRLSSALFLILISGAAWWLLLRR